MLQFHENRAAFLKDEPFIYLFQGNLVEVIDWSAPKKSWPKRFWHWLTEDLYANIHDSGYLF